MTKQLEVRSVSVNYGNFAAVQQVSMSLSAGQIGCLLGPSGCGKTTLLRAIAGFEPVCEGEISLQQALLSSKHLTCPPEQRRVGMVFQDFALFPHLNIEKNVGFGLHHLSRDKKRERAQQMLDLVGLSRCARSFPHQLSGGQQQRIALARALAPAPDLLLLDEPFSSLDADLREALAAEVRSLLKAAGVTAVLVTHDQHEAFAMADHITLLHNGRVVQCATPQQLYQQPVNAFAGGFIGQGTIVDWTPAIAAQLGALTRESIHTGAAPAILIRPEAVRHSEQSSLRLVVQSRVFRGAQYLYQLQLTNDCSILCLTPTAVDISVGNSLPVDIDESLLVHLSRD
jgi:iron(III) transport system ATP-binding protein